MFDHVTLRVSDPATAERQLAAVLTALEVQQTWRTESFAIWGDLAIAATTEDRPATRGAHVALVAPSRAHVDAFWETGIAAGLTDNGPAGPRPAYGPSYYGAFLLDEAGNNLEAVHRDGMRTGGIVDHVGLRVGDVGRSVAFYHAIAASAEVSLARQSDESAVFVGDVSGGSLVLTHGEPTANLHVAFSGDHDAVRGFHDHAIGAGAESNGEPGERPLGTDGYYAAFVLDPDGNNIEVVHRGYAA